MAHKCLLMMLALWLGGCTVAPTSTVEPPDRRSSAPQPYPDPRSNPGSANSGGQYGSNRNYSTPAQPVAPAPAPASVRRAPTTLAYSENSTGVSAADVLLKEGKGQHQQGQYANAANNFERAIRMAPRSPALYLALAKTRLALNDYNNAIQMANRALSLLPNEGWGVDDARADAWTIIADSRAANGDRKGAEAARAKAREYW